MPLRVLIADQRSDQIMPLVEFLIGRGIHPVTATNGGDAVDAIGIQLADQKPFDLVIAHIDLPEIAGLRVLYEARRLNLPTGAALICPSHRIDDKVKGMIKKVGVIGVFEHHIDLARMDRVLKRVVAIRKEQEEKAKAARAAKAQAEAQAKAQAEAQAEAERRAALRREPLVEGFGAERGGATGMFFNSDDDVSEDELPPIDGPGGPPSAPTGVHQILPPGPSEHSPSTSMTAKLPPRPKTSAAGAQAPAGEPQAPLSGAPASPEPATKDRQRRGVGSPPTQAATTGLPKIVKCFRCGSALKVKSGQGVVSVPCGNCGQVNDLMT